MREKGSRYLERERERQGLNGRGTVSEREGEQASWRRGKPGTNVKLARRRESTNKREEQHKPQDEDRACRLQLVSRASLTRTRVRLARETRIGSIPGNRHATGSMHSLTIVKKKEASSSLSVKQFFPGLVLIDR